MASKWIQHVQAYYRAQKKKNPSYSYKKAMSDAKASYKKPGVAAPKKKVRRKRAKKDKRIVE